MRAVAIALALWAPCAAALLAPEPPSEGTPSPGASCVYENAATTAPAGVGDCRGACVASLYSAWVGDGVCDAGRYGRVIQPDGDVAGVDFACEAFANDGGDCAEGAEPSEAAVLAPMFHFGLNEGWGNTVRGYGRGGATYVGELHGAGASWEADEVFGQALRCSEVGADGVTPVVDGEGAHATLNITGADYGASGEFTIGMFFRDLAGPNTVLFEYLLTHGSGLSAENVTGVWDPHNIALYLPEQTHSAAGVARVVVSDANAQGDVVYVDSDGLAVNNEQRNTPGHVDVYDGLWHSLVIVATPALPDTGSARAVGAVGQPGVRIFVDGRYSGLLSGQSGYTGQPVLPQGLLHLCTPLNLSGLRRFSGRMAHVAAWDSALTEAQVLAFHEGALAANSPSNAQQASSGGGGGGSTGGLAAGPGELSFAGYDAAAVCAEREVSAVSAVSGRPCCGGAPVRGDADGDGEMTILDVAAAVRVSLGEGLLDACQEIALDLNGDKTVDLADAETMVAELIQ